MHLLVLSAFRHSSLSPLTRTIRVSMHLLVLSAFRRKAAKPSPNRATVSMHLLVLSAFRHGKARGAAETHIVSMHLLVLSAFRHGNAGYSANMWFIRLNAPFGAQCFPTKSFTLSVTSASCLNAPFGAQCFPTKPPACAYERRQKSQCTFWCSVLSDEKTLDEHMPVRPVSMHLLVLSAFRLLSMRGCMLGLSLNAPFGAQCFPTGNETLPLADQHGSQCTFWCSVLSDINLSSESRFFNWSQCTFWCSVLSDLKNTWRHVVFHIPSQCTFWCSVLSDIKNEIR